MCMCPSASRAHFILDSGVDCTRTWKRFLFFVYYSENVEHNCLGERMSLYTKLVYFLIVLQFNEIVMMEVTFETCVNIF